MSSKSRTSDLENVKPNHEFDARFFVDGRSSPLCGVKVWLPIDCHEDARIQVVGSHDLSRKTLRSEFDWQANLSRLVSDINPKFGFEVEAEDVHCREIITTHGLRVEGTHITIGHIGILRFKTRLDIEADTVDDLNEPCTDISFRLSDLNYGRPRSSSTVDFRGNRSIKVMRVFSLKMQLANKVLRFQLQRHWSWSRGDHTRISAGSSPVLELKNARSIKWSKLEEMQRVGRDACLLLTLAARHLTVVHVTVAGSKKIHQEEWFYPLNRQRSTTEEEATGPLVDEQDLEDYFFSASVRWSSFTDRQRDVVRLAVYSMHPFDQSSMEGSFLRMFTALEGLATAWFPKPKTLAEKIQALVAAFPPRVGGLWPITDSNKDGLSAIRNLLAHGDDTREARRESISAGADHLKIWIERILLSILNFQYKESRADWLSRHVLSQRDELPRLRAAIKVG